MDRVARDLLTPKADLSSHSIRRASVEYWLPSSASCESGTEISNLFRSAKESLSAGQFCDGRRKAPLFVPRSPLGRPWVVTHGSLSVPKVEVDQCSCEARLRLEQFERLPSPRPPPARNGFRRSVLFQPSAAKRRACPRRFQDQPFSERSGVGLRPSCSGRLDQLICRHGRHGR